MKWLFVGLVALHGLIHFVGVAAAFGLAAPAQLTQPIPRGFGVVWLLAALATLGAAALLAASVRFWWLAALAAVALSQTAILGSWSDARWGTIVNVVLLLGTVYGFASEGPLGFRAEYRRAVAEGFGKLGPTPPELVTEADLAHLPDPVRRYVRLSGAIGRPRVTHFRAKTVGRIRSAPGEPWMSFTAEQHNFVDEPSRYYLMLARRSGLPADVLHEYRAGDASMRVRLASLLPIADARGEEMGRTETVTVLNDLCLLAPGALIDPSIEWEEIDPHRALARYTAGSHTITAELMFDDQGRLVDFVSDDRRATVSANELRPWRWSTPVSDYREYGPAHAASRGAGWWHPPDGAFPYIELELVELEVNGVAP